jgi:hypothetical protein
MPPPNGQGPVQDAPAPLIDPGNRMLAFGQPAHLDTGIVTQPDGSRLGILTFRTATTTLTVTLVQADVVRWGELILALGRSMPGGSGLIVAGPGSVPGV